MQDTPETTEEIELIDRPEVERISGLSASGIYRGARLGTFPKPLKLGPQRSKWIKREVVEWRDKKIAERDRGRAA